MSGIGSRLRQERERLGLSQKVFGEIGGVEANAQGKYESGGRVPKADYLQAIDVSQHSCNACTNEIMVIDY